MLLMRLKWAAIASSDYFREGLAFRVLSMNDRKFSPMPRRRKLSRPDRVCLRVMGWCSSIVVCLSSAMIVINIVRNHHSSELPSVEFALQHPKMALLYRDYSREQSAWS